MKKVTLCLFLVLTIIFNISCGNTIPGAEVVDEVSDEANIEDFPEFIPFAKKEPAPVLTLEPELEVITNKNDEKETEELKITVDFAYNLDPAEYENKLPIRYGQGDDIIIIHSNKYLRNLSLDRIKFEDDKNIFYVEENIFSSPMFPPEHYIEYAVTIQDGIPTEGITFTISDKMHNDQDKYSYVLARDIVEAEIHYIAYSSDIEYYESLITQFELIDGAKLIITEGEYKWSDGVYIKYDDGDLIRICDRFYLLFLDVSPDKTKISYTLLDHGGGPFYIFDVISRERTYIDEFDRFDQREVSKRAIWLDNEILLVTVGLDQGSVTKGGDIHYYNRNTGANGKIIEAKKTGKSLTEFTWMKLYENTFKFDVCVHFDYVNYNFYYNESITIEQIYNLIENNETYMYESMVIDNSH